MIVSGRRLFFHRRSSLSMTLTTIQAVARWRGIGEIWVSSQSMPAIAVSPVSIGSTQASTPCCVFRIKSIIVTEERRPAGASLQRNLLPLAPMNEETSTARGHELRFSARASMPALREGAGSIRLLSPIYGASCCSPAIDRRGALTCL